MQSHNDRIDDDYFEGDGERSAGSGESLWLTARRLYPWRRFLIGVTGAVAIVAAVISLLMPNWYRAETRLLLPESGTSGGISAALLGNISSVARGFLGGKVGDYTRYIAILTSRTMYESAVDSFNLVNVYETDSSKDPRGEAVTTLRDNVTFVVDEKYEFLSIEVLDRDPTRAAAMANFFVRRLNDANRTLASQTAANFRMYAESRYDESMTRLDSVLSAIEQFQKQYRVYDLPVQAETFFGQVADLRAKIIETEIQYEAARDRLGPENAQVRALLDGLNAAQKRYANFLAGEEQLFPVSQANMPGMIRQFADLERERIIQGRILEIIAPMVEEARFEEQRKVEAVQVVDPAIPPSRKAKPRRTTIVLSATASAFLLAMFFALAMSWWQRKGISIVSQVRYGRRPPVTTEAERIS